MRYTILLLFIFPYFRGFATIPLSADEPYIQSFDSMGTGLTLPQDWRASYGASSATWLEATNLLSYTANSGTPNQPGLYNWSTTSNIDRAAGALIDSSKPISERYSSLLAHFYNASSSIISEINVSFDAKAYSTNNDDIYLKLLFSYDGSTWYNAYTSKPGNFYTGAREFNFTSPLTKFISQDIILDLKPSENLYLQFQIYFGRQAVGFDNISVTPIPEPSIFSYTLATFALFIGLRLTHKGLTRRCS